MTNIPENTTVEVVKKKRGRPRKAENINNAPEPITTLETENVSIPENNSEDTVVETVKKKRGRPRKTKSTEETPTVTYEKVIDLANLSANDIRDNPITSRAEVRNAVETYYDIQDFRIRSGNRRFAVNKSNDEIESCVEDGETSVITNKALYLQLVEHDFKRTEETIAKFLGNYAKNDPIGKWLLSITGIGPVLAAALLSYIDISRCETAGSIWQYAGWAGPMKPKQKGEKINYNPKFRVICWKIGRSFIKVSGNKNDIYGKLYKAKKEWYIAKNEAGGFAEKAAYELSAKKYSPDTASYKAYIQGKLPDSQITDMAARFAVKMFLSHLFTLWYEYDRGRPAPKPFVEAHLGHVHIMPPPNREIIFGDKLSDK